MRPHMFSIRVTLVWVALLAALPSFGVILYDSHRLASQLKGEAEASVTRAASSITALQERVADGARQTLTILAALPDVRRLDPAACEAVFREVLAEDTTLLNLLALDANGDLVASARQPLPLPGQAPFNLADRLYFRTALRDKRFVSGEYVVARTLHEATFHFALPLVDDEGRVYGVLAAPMRLNQYDDLFDKLNLPPGSVLSVTDHRGIRLAYHPQSDVNPVGKPIRKEILNILHSMPDAGLFTRESSDGRVRLYGFTRVRLYPESAPYLNVMVGIPEEAVLAPVRAARNRALLLLGGAMAVTLAVAWSIGGRLVARPLSHISATATRIGEGQLGARTGIRHDMGEIGQLAFSVDSMAAILASRQREREAFTAELRDNEARYRAVFDNAMDAILLADADTGLILDANRAAQQVFGYTRDELVGMHQRQLHPDRTHRNGFGGRFNTLREQPLELPAEMPMRTRAGIERDMLVKARLMRVGDRDVAVGMFHDITERRQSEQQLREVEARFRSIVEGAPLGLLLLTLDQAEHLRIEAVNPTADTALHITGRGLLGRRLTEALPGIGATNLPTIFVGIARKGGEFSVTAHASSGWLPAGWAFVDLWVFRTGNRQIAVMFADVTRRTRAEDELRQTRDRAEKANRSKSEFVAVMSHEVRTPINGIMGMLQLLRGSHLSGDQEDCVDTALGASRNLLRILDDILDISRMEAGALPLVEESFTVAQMTEPVHAMLAPQAKAKGLAFTMQAAPDLPPEFAGDAGRIRQVLVNLVSNAVKCTDTGEVRVEIYPLPRCGMADRVSIHMAIIDTGIGFAPERLRTLFESYTTDSAATTRPGGTGLGLAIVRRLVLLMNGTICVATAPGEGTEFHITLPLRAEGERPKAPRAVRRGAPTDIASGTAPDAAPDVPADAPPNVAGPAPETVRGPGVPPAHPRMATPPVADASAGAPAAARDTAGGATGGHAPDASRTPPRILVVDDDEVNLVTAQRLLIRLGYFADRAASGRQALEMLGRDHYDAVLMDIQMPDMDGMEVTRRIRMREAVPPGATSPWVPVLALTAHAMLGDRERFLAAGMNEYLAKPIEIDQLDALLRALLRV
ncbi:response regulator [Desulfovibrio oxamicus]|uniref:histidine kinase n=1 Tax=Nitratidesulfovibrio oxamicus TaxID=32016 RepID=A0ABS0J6Z4_9BACT|nr:ATP-binding protein [Nitratidesulfovibrio oxamicus]MBG3877902.1 response regulator [Nitratidesulfovibrio oxamicus]